MKNKGSLLHSSLPTLEHQCQEKESLQQLAMKTSKDSVRVRWRAAVDPGVFLKGLRTDSFHSLTNTGPNLQRRDKISKSTRGIFGETELSGIGVRPGGADLPRTKVQKC